MELRISLETIAVITFICIQLTNQNSLGGTPLYGPNDKIVLLNTTNFQSTICGSSTAWLVEFYSSWCGHCIHFAPTFKELAEDVYSWRGVMAVAAIDCAMEYNMETCREYEVMGYPTIKFFSPNTPAGDMGHERKSRDKTIPVIETDMIKFLSDLQATNNVSRIGTNWPKLLPATVIGTTVPELWLHGAVYAILIFEEQESMLGSSVTLDLSEVIQQLKVPVIVSRVLINSGSQQLIEKLKVGTGGGLVAVSRDMEAVHSFPGVSMTRKDMVAAVKDFIWDKSGDLAVKNSDTLKQSYSDNKNSDKSGNGNKVSPARTPSRKEVMTRRYKIHMSDLEKALVYAISHEVAQHSAITHHTLAALQQFVTVLEKYFPARIEMALLLRELKSWVHKHQDTIRGEDLSSWFKQYQSQHNVQVSEQWIGCKGSADMYGGYPCGLWSLWHALTVSQADHGQGDPKEVLLAMKGYIQEFFGCRECARHFDQAIDGGKLFDEEVKNYQDSVLVLWLVHNKANIRLSGDISEDPVFPKLKFPSKEFCSSCYDGTVRGTNLWTEFNKDAVFKFLQNLYSRSKISSMGIQETSNHDHELAVIPKAEETYESLDTSNYKKEENSSSFIFFNGADISICLFLWFLSAILLILIYLKFVAGVKFSNSYFFHGLKRKTSSRNPLLGRV